MPSFLHLVDDWRGNRYHTLYTGSLMPVSTRISWSLYRTAHHRRAGGDGMGRRGYGYAFLSACPGSVWKWLGVERSPLNGQKVPEDTRAHPKVSGQGTRGGHQHGWISCPAYSAQVFKWVWAVLILLKALLGPGLTNGQTNTHIR